MVEQFRPMKTVFIPIAFILIVIWLAVIFVMVMRANPLCGFKPVGEEIKDDGLNQHSGCMCTWKGYDCKARNGTSGNALNATVRIVKEE